MAYSPKYSSIKYSGKSPEELLETSDWFIEAIQGMRTWNALVEERANKKYRQWEREVTKENYTLSAIDTVVNLAKSQPDDAAVYDDSLKELNRIFENSTVKDPKTSALVTKGRIAKKFLTRERAEIATVQQIFERLNDRNTVFTHENIYNQVNEPGWDPTSGEKSNTEKLLDDAQDWLNDEQSELERMERYDGSIKLEIEKLRKEYVGASSARKAEIQKLIQNRQTFMDELTGGMTKNVKFNFTPNEVKITNLTKPIDTLKMRELGLLKERGTAFEKSILSKGKDLGLVTKEGQLIKKQISDKNVLQMLTSAGFDVGDCG